MTFCVQPILDAPKFAREQAHGHGIIRISLETVRHQPAGQGREALGRRARQTSFFSSVTLSSLM